MYKITSCKTLFNKISWWRVRKLPSPSNASNPLSLCYMVQRTVNQQRSSQSLYVSKVFTLLLFWFSCMATPSCLCRKVALILQVILELFENKGDLSTLSPSWGRDLLRWSMHVMSKVFPVRTRKPLLCLALCSHSWERGYCRLPDNDFPATWRQFLQRK